MCRRVLKNEIQNLIFKKEEVRNPARIPPQTPPAGEKTAEAGLQNPRQIVSPCRVRISIFNHLDFARNSFKRSSNIF